MSGGEQPGVSALTRPSIVAPPGPPAEHAARADGPDWEAPSSAGPTRPPASLPSSVVHDLRTPLTSIHGYAQVLQRTLQAGERSANAASVIVRESARLSAMLAELSELSELDGKDLSEEPVDVEVHQIVDGVVHDVTRRDDGAHQIQFEGSARARCHPTILSQTIGHVLNNAVRYSAHGSPIEVTIRARGQRTEILVGDRGISIEQTDAQRIYEPFERGLNAREAGVRGLGLGLYLARRALEQVDGTIQHRPREGGGTWFRISVPGA